MTDSLSPEHPATEAYRARMIERLGHYGMATDYFRRVGCLLENESVDELPLRHVPATAKQMNELQEAFLEFESGDPARRVSFFDWKLRREPEKKQRKRKREEATA